MGPYEPAVDYNQQQALHLHPALPAYDLTSLVPTGHHNNYRPPPSAITGN